MTTNNLVTNPRLVKEIKLAVSNGYNATVLIFKLGNWGHEINESIKQSFQSVKFIEISALKSSLFPWLLSSLIQKVCRVVPFFSSATLSISLDKRSFLLQNALRNTNEKFDLIVAHNPGALWPAYCFAKRKKVKVGFDMEDYHPGEGSNLKLRAISKELFSRVLPFMDYVSFASPLIKNETEKLLGTSKSDWFQVLNYFPSSEFVQPVKKISEVVRIIWFSQNISFNRGLEMVLPIFNRANGKAELHLYGNLNNNFYKKHLKGVKNIIIQKPLPQQELHEMLSKFDIGLAIEPGKDLNNNLAVSNKILAYLQAGLFIIATDTPAQKELLNNFPDNGVYFNIYKKNFNDVLNIVVLQSAKIREKRDTRYFQNKAFSWERESLKILNQWRRLINAE